MLIVIKWLQAAEALPEVTATSSPEKKLIFPTDTSAIKDASLILMREKNGAKPTLVRVRSGQVPLPKIFSQIKSDLVGAVHEGALFKKKFPSFNKSQNVAYILYL